MYNPTAASCKALTKLSITQTNEFYSEWPTGLPWIYYNGDVESVIHNSDKMKGIMSLSKSSIEVGQINYLNFKLAAYHLNGTFMGFEELTNQLQLCSSGRKDGMEFRRFGVSVNIDCEFDLTQLLLSSRPKESDIFYEAFIEDSDGSLIDVPILVWNMEDGTNDAPN